MLGSPKAVASMGLSTNVSKVLVFCTSTFLAGIAVTAWRRPRGFAVGGDSFYLPFTSLVLLAI